MQDENNIFSGIPSLDDDQGLAQYLEQQTVSQFDNGNEIPNALQQTNSNEGNDNVSNNATQPQVQSNGTTYSAEQVQNIINTIHQQYAQQTQRQAAPQAQPQRQVQQAPTYSQAELNAINQMLSRGYSLEQVLAAVQNNRAKTGVQRDPALVQKINNIEQYLYNQQYKAEQTAFIDKMTAFGNRLGLSENDLVTFGNAALAQGINLINVPDVEMVFKMIYPEQYAIRTQRMSNTQTSQIYGGTSVPETNRALNEKAMDAYVDSFLKRSMPNQYGMQRK